jgi:acyl transferase domain-containing protein/acyl carrier protein
MSKTDSFDTVEAVAVVGMACRFPGARDVTAFWRNLREGVEAISFFSEEELEAAGVKPDAYRDPAYVPAKGVLDDVDMFDASFFGLTPREAEIMDPQQRLFLETAWEALENAGYDCADGKGRVGIYAGSGLSTYFLFNLMSNPSLFETVSSLQVRMMNDKDFLTTLASYKLNLTGPSVAVQTACSTSLVAAHLACQGLLDGECDMALAGGVAVSFPHKSGHVFTAGEIWSPDGHCRAFDAGAQGTVEGNGVGIVVLKRLEDARADGDFIHAIIRGSAVNNDGSFKAGYTAPSVESQAQVILEALSMAGVGGESISYVEAHGSATPLGDPIEVGALTRAFRSSTDKKNFCALGSVKTNLGHLDNAAGSASLIKTIEALKHKVIPPTLHFRRPNPQIDLAESPFYVNNTAIEWTSDSSPRRAGVSSLGIGGTNAHLVLEEAPPKSPDADSASRSNQLLLLSARTESALDAATANLAKHLRAHREVNLADAAYTLQVGRRRFNHRRMLVCRELNEAATRLEALDPRFVFTGSCDVGEPEVAFMFPGLGDHHVGMAQDLYREEKVFREYFDYCSDLLKLKLNLNLVETLYPARTSAQTQQIASPPARRNHDLRKLLARAEREDDPATLRLNQTSIAQPAVFVIEYALAKLLMKWGIRPQALIGYSIGEYVAACLAGVFSLEDALFLVAERARLIGRLPAGAMLAVPLPEDELRPFLDSSLSLCVSNGPSLSVIGGLSAALEILEQKLSEQSVAFRRLETSHAFHSHMMEPILEQFEKEASRIRLSPPQVPFISNVTGTWITPEDATDPAYWARHLRQTVRFADGIQELLKNPRRVVLEVGPGQSLATLARQHKAKQADQVVLSSMRDRHDEISDVEVLLTAVGQLWVAGVRVDWQGFYEHERRLRVPLPTYPFERRRYWIEPGESTTVSSVEQGKSEKKTNIADWFYVPTWRRSRARALPSNGDLPQDAKRWLIFLDDLGLGSRMAHRLRELGSEVLTVKIGEDFRTDGEYGYALNPKGREDYDVLIKELRERQLLPTRIAHLWSVTAGIAPLTDVKEFDRLQDRGFYSLLFIAQALGEHDVSAPLQIGVVTNHLFEVTGEESCCPHKATVSGPCKVIPQEYQNIACRTIDIVTPQTVMASEGMESLLCDQFIAELIAPSPDPVVAYRGSYRWVRDFEPARLETTNGISKRLRNGGSYLITGADGELGLLLAEHLVRSFNAKVSLIASSEFPPRDKWERWLGGHDDQDEISGKIRRLRALEMDALGNEVLFSPADVCSESQMQAVLTRTLARFGELNGVIHAASVPGAGIIQLKTRAMAAAVLAPKTKGTQVLAACAKKIPLDFFVLFSSSVSVAGGFGQVDACAANAFLDAFAQSRSHRGEGFTLAIDWGAFQWDEWQLPGEMGPPDLQTQLHEHLQQSGISASECLEAFERTLGDTLPQIIVCPQDLSAVIQQTDAFTVANFLEELEKSRPAEAHPRPAMAVTYVPPRDEVEQVVAKIWQESFGMAQVGVEDNFFDLAGNSLLAIQIVTRLRRAFEIELPMTSLFDAPTISELSQMIKALRFAPSEGPEPEGIERLLSEIEGLSFDEAEKKFAEELGAGE